MKLEIENLSKNFGDLQAVDDVSMTIEDGEFITFVGPSGCGKTTTLRCVAGLEPPSSGTISLDGEDVTYASPGERNVAFVFQDYALYPHMTARKNMSFALEDGEMSDEEIQRSVEETAGMLGIREHLDQKPGELSGGQQQRVALGRSIVRDPKVFLLDEPLANLDAKLRAEMRTELQRLQEDLGTTSIYVTHDQTEAMTMSDRIAILDGGELQQVGTPMECYHEPANVFVAGFIGEPSMNFFDVTLEGGVLVCDDFRYPLSDAATTTVQGTENLVMGIRPENIDIVEDPTGDDELPALIDVVEPHGNENAVHLRFPDQSNGERFTATVGGMRNLSANQDVGVKFPEDSIHLFDAETGDALRNRVIEDFEQVEQIGTT